MTNGSLSPGSSANDPPALQLPAEVHEIEETDAFPYSLSALIPGTSSACPHVGAAALLAEVIIETR
jgi:hypothetical protein